MITTLVSPQFVNSIEEGSAKNISTVEELVASVGDATVKKIVITQDIKDAPTFRLSPGQQLIGKAPSIRIIFSPDADGLQLSSDNKVSLITLETSVEKRAIYNDATVDTLGTISITDVMTKGQVQIIARDKVRSGHLLIDHLDVIAADARQRSERPHDYGVHVQQGAVTIWNLQPNPDILLTAELSHISIGREGSPVLGGGLFVGGQSDAGGRIKVSKISTGPIFSDGKLPPGTANIISGGVFVLYGASVEEVRCEGPVTTYGVNDMVLDNWGAVNHWIAEAPIKSHGPSGVGFVNFGTLNELRILAPVETFGTGARGFNVYTGQVTSAEFHSIITHGDAAVGVQVSKPLGRLTVHHGIKTEGGIGGSLVKGVIKQLPAYAISILEGAEVDEIEVHGGVVTIGDGVTTLKVQGEVRALRVSDGISAFGKDSDAIVVDGGTLPLTNLIVKAKQGAAIKLNRAHITALLKTIASGSSGDVVVESDSTVTTDVTSAGELGKQLGNQFSITGADKLKLSSFEGV